MPPRELVDLRVAAVTEVGDLERALDRGACGARARSGRGARTRAGSARRSASRRGCRAAARRRSARARPSTPSGACRPRISISPSSGIACAVSRRIVVDLPAPLGPSRPTQVPSGTSRSRWSTAVRAPKRLTTPRRREGGHARPECHAAARSSVREAAVTSASKRFECATSVSACHCTPTMKPSPSIPSTVPSLRARHDPQAFADLVDRLVMEGVRADRALAHDPVQPRARLDLDLVRGLGRRRGLAVARDVLVQRPAAGDVERLGAAADGEDRQAALEGEPDQAQLEGVEARLGRPELDVALGRAVGRRVEVGAAGEADAVEAIQQRGEVVGAGRREHHGDRADRVERAQVGHPQRHLGVRRLAVAAGRRQPRRDAAPRW